MNLKMLKIICLLYSSVFLVGICNAQTYSISGRVTDMSGTPLIGVNIILLDTDYGASTDEDGNYYLTDLQPGNYTIEFSSIGYKKKRIDSAAIHSESIKIDVELVEAIIESDEVIITAGKYEQRKSDLPVSAEIIPGEEFKKNNFSNLEDALRYVPGVNMTDDQISIRGSSGYSRGAGSRALLAIDGLTFYTGDTGETVWEMIPVTELQRVEVIKGAASSLYGSSAIGGVINGITRKISKNPLTTVNGFYGFYDKPYYNKWDWSGELRPFNGLTVSHSNTFGKFGFNISLTRLEDLSYRQDDFFKKYLGFLKAEYSFTSASSLTLLANTFNKRSGNFLYWKNSRNALVPPDANRNERIETDRYLIGLIYKTVFSDDLYLNIRTSYYRNYFKDSGAASNESASNLYRGEFQLTANVTKEIILTSGIEGSTADVNSNLFGNPTAFGLGLYSVADINFNFPLIASVGLRYDYSKLDSLNGSGAVSPKLGLNYKPLNYLILRSSFGTGFRAPSLAEAFTSTSTSGITVKPNPFIESESNFTFEIGVNYIPAEFINFDFAAFQNEYYNMIEPGIDPSDGLVVFENVVRARIQGFETNSLIELISNQLLLNFNYTYMWARNLETGKALKYRPRHLFYSKADLRIWNFEFGIDFRFWSKVEEIDDELVELGIVVDGEKRVPVYLVDLRFNYDLISFSLPVNLYFNIKNLFNYNYVELIGNIRRIRSYSFGLNLAI